MRGTVILELLKGKAKIGQGGVVKGGVNLNILTYE